MAESSAKLKKKQVDPLKRTVFSLALPIFFQSLLGLSLGYIDTIMLSKSSPWRGMLMARAKVSSEAARFKKDSWN